MFCENKFARNSINDMPLGITRNCKEHLRVPFLVSLIKKAFLPLVYLSHKIANMQMSSTLLFL